MLWFKQLDFFSRFEVLETTAGPSSAGEFLRDGADERLNRNARALLFSIGAPKLAPQVRVEWNRRMRTAAGRADFHNKLISLNPRLQAHGAEEIDRTLRHELAHLVARFRAGRRRIAPHGAEWRQACCDLGIGEEQRCHALPFPSRAPARRFLYRCPVCAADFPRVRRIKRRVACLACCRRENGGAYDKRFQLRLVNSASEEPRRVAR